MKKFLLFFSLYLVLSVSPQAMADIWRWVDAYGNDHYVTTNKPIYTWLDELGAVHFSDRPDHPDAARAHLIWHSSGSAASLPETADENAVPGETDEERAQRLGAEAYYCNQAKDIYETYRNAPQLYSTNDDGTRYYLSVAEMAEALAEAEANVELLCG